MSDNEEATTVSREFDDVAFLTAAQIVLVAQGYTDLTVTTVGAKYVLDAVKPGRPARSLQSTRTP